MVAQYFRAVHVQARLRAGGLGEYADEVIAYLDRRGHRVSTVQTYVQAMEHFARWVRQRGETLRAVDAATVTRFLTGHLPRCHCPTPAPCRRRGMRAPLRHLLTVLGVPALARTRAVAPPAAMAPVLADYAAHLHATCGLAPATCRYRLRYAREFLGAHFGRGRIDATALTARDIRAFVTRRATPSTPGTAQVIASSVRSLLRFLQLRGDVSPALVHAVPSVARWQQAHLPRVLTTDELRRLWAAFDRTTPTGRRDYAIALCLTELGLRVSEVPPLTLDDVQWREGVLRVAVGKGRRAHVLPLPAAVVRALAIYVHRDRPATAVRQLFVRHTPPVGTAVSAALVRGVIRRAYARARLDAGTGTHILRHTAATRLLHSGASLKAIADLLRHRSLDTTTIYTKVDLPRLRAVALPWPEDRP
jgi:integrase/recombinase XerD